jgi:hypothetical protein
LNRKGAKDAKRIFNVQAGPDSNPILSNDTISKEQYQLAGLNQIGLGGLCAFAVQFTA